MLAFLLDIVEVPESHTGAVMAQAFQNMLKQFGVKKKVRAVVVVLCCTG
jgi:hypothetical protein